MNLVEVVYEQVETNSINQIIRFVGDELSSLENSTDIYYQLEFIISPDRRLPIEPT